MQTAQVMARSASPLHPSHTDSLPTSHPSSVDWQPVVSSSGRSCSPPQSCSDMQSKRPNETTANVASEAIFDSEGLRIRLSALASAVAFSRPTIKLNRSEILHVSMTTTNEVAREIRWKLAGTALSRRRALGWFSWIGHPRRFAWVWLTPNRQIVRFETAHTRPGMLTVPLDWFDEDSRAAIQSSLTNPR